MSARRPYVRPMTGWWRRNPYFVEYMVHEGTALCVAAYAVVLLAGVVALGRGAEAWERWLGWLRTPPAIALHVVLLAGFVYHAATWFRIMPRTMPPIRIGGGRVSARAITAAGIAAAVIASAMVYVFIARLAT